MVTVIANVHDLLSTSLRTFVHVEIRRQPPRDPSVVIPLLQIPLAQVHIFFPTSVSQIRGG